MAAAAIYSSSNLSSFLRSVSISLSSCCSTKSRSSKVFASRSFSKHGVVLAHDDVANLQPPTESLAVSAGSFAASASGMKKLFDYWPTDANSSTGEWGWKVAVGIRRKRTRKRRKAALENSKIYEHQANQPITGSAARGLCFTPRDEAVCCPCKEEGAEVEALRKWLKDSTEYDLTPNEKAEAAGLISFDEILLREKLSQEQILKHYRKLVSHIAAGYLGKGLSWQDLMQEGSIGLLHGVKKFLPNRGNKLSTYVYWWIRQAITRAIEKNSRIIRLPGNVCEVVPRIYHAKAMLSSRLKRLPTYDEVAEALEIDSLTVRLVMYINRSLISLDSLTTSQDGLSLQDIMPGPCEITPQEMVRRQLMKQNVYKLLKMLSKREATVVVLRYGLNGGTPQSWEEIGKSFKLSRERVRQISRRALSKLRHSIVVDDLNFYVQ